MEYLTINRAYLEKVLLALQSDTQSPEWPSRYVSAVRILVTALEGKTEPMKLVGEMKMSYVIKGLIVPVVPVDLPVGTKLYAALTA
jgi:hypothetical protein